MAGVNLSETIAEDDRRDGWLLYGGHFWRVGERLTAFPEEDR
ncbi:hypothetical protein [Paracoccus sp. IB05]|nr:hypothetical protein [Paracoccus sp. IB05]